MNMPEDNEICKNCPNHCVPDRSEKEPATMHPGRVYCKMWLGWVDETDGCELFGNTSREAFKYAQGL